jgi:hypothetical protein
MRGSAANYYHPEGFDTSDKTLMGRQAAGEAFLKAYALHSGTAQLYCYTKSKAMFDDFRARLADLTGRAQAAEWIPHQKVNELEKAGCLFVPGPNTADMVWQRRHFDVRGYSVCGVTHTTAYQALWDTLAARRRSAGIIAGCPDNGPAHPLRNDPFTVFAGYPSAYLDGQARIALNPGAAQNWFKKIRQDPMVSFAPYIFLSDDDMDRPLEKLDEIGECDINTVLEASASAQRGVVHRTLAWLTKLNVIRIVSARKRADG